MRITVHGHSAFRLDFGGKAGGLTLIPINKQAS